MKGSPPSGAGYDIGEIKVAEPRPTMPKERDRDLGPVHLAAAAFASPSEPLGSEFGPLRSREMRQPLYRPY